MYIIYIYIRENFPMHWTRWAWTPIADALTRCQTKLFSTSCPSRWSTRRAKAFDDVVWFVRWCFLSWRSTANFLPDVASGVGIDFPDAFCDFCQRMCTSGELLLLVVIFFNCTFIFSRSLSFECDFYSFVYLS